MSQTLPGSLESSTGYNLDDHDDDEDVDDEHEDHDRELVDATDLTCLIKGAVDIEAEKGCGKRPLQEHSLNCMSSNTLMMESGSIINGEQSKPARGHWRPAEDDKLKKLVAQYGPQNWNLIAENLQGRSGKSCRLRWFNQLDPRINRRPFSQEEEDRLLVAHRLYGNKWAMIARMFPGRTDNAVKNHWHVIMARLWREQFRGTASTSAATNCHSGGGGHVPRRSPHQFSQHLSNPITKMRLLLRAPPNTLLSGAKYNNLMPLPHRQPSGLSWKGFISQHGGTGAVHGPEVVVKQDGVALSPLRQVAGATSHSDFLMPTPHKQEEVLPTKIVLPGSRRDLVSINTNQMEKKYSITNNVHDTMKYLQPQSSLYIIRKQNQNMRPQVEPRIPINSLNHSVKRPRIQSMTQESTISKLPTLSLAIQETEFLVTERPTMECNDKIRLFQKYEIKSSHTQHVGSMTSTHHVDNMISTHFIDFLGVGTL